jgi:hypothetical protein
VPRCSMTLQKRRSEPWAAGEPACRPGFCRPGFPGLRLCVNTRSDLGIWLSPFLVGSRLLPPSGGTETEQASVPRLDVGAHAGRDLGRAVID